MKKIAFLISLFCCAQLNAQTGQLSAFKNLINSTWISEGKQLGGHEGKTEKTFSLGLDGKLIKVVTYTTDPKTLEFGLRNEGVRIFNEEKNEIEFYEFDKLGGITRGVVMVEGQNLHYQYSYGEYTLRDSWIYVSENKYQYRVCSIVDNQCEAVYHESHFTRLQ